MKRRQAASPKSPLIRLVGLEAAIAATGIAGCLTAVAAPAGIEFAPSPAKHRPNIGSPSFTGSTGSEQSRCTATAPDS